MADLGAIGSESDEGLLVYRSLAGPGYLKHIVLGDLNPLLYGASRDDIQGNPTAPSQSHPRPGVLKDLFWKVSAGTHTLTIDCKYGGGAVKPRIILRANPAIGVPTDIVVNAPAGSGWTLLTTGPLTITADGVLEVWRERLEPDLSIAHNWDNITVT